MEEAKPKQAREVSDQDEALAKVWLKRIADAVTDRKDAHKKWEDNRKLLRGIDPSGEGKRLHTNLHFANLASMRPQVYAKDPEFSVDATKAVPESDADKVRAFGTTAEAVLDKLLVRDAKLKKHMKRNLTSAYTTALGWTKVCWQESPDTDPQIANRLKDTQDNIDRLAAQRAALDDVRGGDMDAQLAEMREALAGLQQQAEVKVSRGIALDFVLPEDVVVLDPSVMDISDYARASAIAHGAWVTREQYRARYGYDPEKAKIYRQQAGANQPQEGADGAKARDSQLFRVWEAWDQDSNRVFTLCEGEEGFCKPPMSPDWTGRRWYPLFLLTFNEVDSGLPLSDVELTADVVKEYNDDRQALRQDRKDARPFTVVRKGGSLTPQDVENIRNRKGNDIITVEGIGGKPLKDDVEAVQLGGIDAAVYDTSPARQDMEMLVGGGDAARGSVLKAKTATEAEILAQGLRGRAAERTDIIEDLLSEMGEYVLEIALRKLSSEDVKKIAGPRAMWPELTADEVFEQVTVRVRGGSTGKPNELQEQDRWTKLLPVIKDTIKEVAVVREQGHEDLAQAAIALLRETLRRFDERFDIDQYLPPPKEGEEPANKQPEIPPELMQKIQEQMQELTQRAETAEQALKDKSADIALKEKQAVLDAEAKVRVAEIVAPIEAQAKVEVARVTAEQQAQVDAHRATLDAESGAADRASKDAETAAAEGGKAELAELRGQVDAIGGAINKLGEILNQPKPRMKVMHIPGANGRIAESKLVPDEV